VLRLRGDAYSPALAFHAQRYSKVRYGWQIAHSFRPFHQTDVARLEVVPKACIVPFLWIVEPIKIKVI
jgi:hypothetical protein